MSWAGRVSLMGQEKTVCKGLMGKARVKRPLG
jgi:hypothetical protein